MKKLGVAERGWVKFGGSFIEKASTILKGFFLACKFPQCRGPHLLSSPPFHSCLEPHDEYSVSICWTNRSAFITSKPQRTDDCTKLWSTFVSAKSSLRTEASTLLKCLLPQYSGNHSCNTNGHTHSGKSSWQVEKDQTGSSLSRSSLYKSRSQLHLPRRLNLKKAFLRPHTQQWPLLSEPVGRNSPVCFDLMGRALAGDTGLLRTLAQNATLSHPLQSDHGAQQPFPSHLAYHLPRSSHVC